MGFERGRGRTVHLDAHVDVILRGVGDAGEKPVSKRARQCRMIAVESYRST
jgi:hypothetical protein